MLTKSSPTEIAVYTIRISRQKLAVLHEIADAENRTLAGQIRWLFDREIADHAVRETT